MDRVQVTSSRAVYVISVAAELADMHPQTLRMYERKGLLEPARTSGGSRRYSDDDIARLQRIASLASEGMNLSGIRRVMELEAENARLREQIAEAERRNPRRDLVPVRQAMAMFGQRDPSRRRSG
jgi:MerR family transcriptional regulator/heat shock protein HspR